MRAASSQRLALMLGKRKTWIVNTATSPRGSIDWWRRRTETCTRTSSEAIRRLVEMGLESAKKARQHGR